jgi:hypothetical protein
MSGLVALDGHDLSTLFEKVHSENSRLFTVNRSASGPRTERLEQKVFELFS